MTELFYTILNMSISASVLVLVVLLLRLLFHKAPKWVTVLLWGLVAVRLICPFALETPFSLMPKTEWITETPAYDEENQYFASVPADRIPVDTTLWNDIYKEIPFHYYQIEPHIQINRGVNPAFVLNCIWLAGIAGMLVYMLVSYICVYRRIRGAEKFQGNVYTSASVASPFVFGLIRPRIYLPENLDAVSMSFVIAHEEAHIRRRDHWWKPLGFLLLTVHWFNPLLWVSYILLCRDIEMACDERVVKEMDDRQRADYSEALLECSVNKKMISACPLAFGEVGVKARIKSVLHYKKPAFWFVILAMIASIVAAVCFLTNPIIHKPAISIDEHDWYFERAYIRKLEKDITIEAYQPGLQPKTKNAEPVNAVLVPGDEPMWYDLITGDWETNRFVNHFILEKADSKSAHYTVELYRDTGEWYSGVTSTAVIEPMKNGDGYVLTIYENSVGHEKEIIFTTKKQPGAVQGEKKLTLDDVLTLSEKQTSLTWEDFAEYAYTDVGTWNFRCIYEIDDVFWLEVVGGSMHGTPMQINLCTKADYGDGAKYVDIRKNSADEDIVENFINENKNVLFPSGEPEPSRIKSDLTLEDVVTLSAKGEDLTWEDFEEFNFIETGSGLYIRVYEIDDTFSVWIGGGSPVSTPMYIRLKLNDGDAYADVTKDDVAAFVAEHDPVKISVDSSVTVPQPVLEYALSLVKSHIDTYNGYGESQKAVTGTTYTIAEAKIISISRFDTGTAGLSDACYLYKMECLLKPTEADPTNIFLAGEMLLEDGCFKITQPYFAMYHDWSGGEEVWKPIGVINELTIANEYATKEMLNKYGNMYTAALMEKLGELMASHKSFEINDSAEFTAVIKEFDTSAFENGMMHLNIVEFITPDDTERIAELELSEQDMISGYYIHDKDESIAALRLPEDTEYIFFDWSDTYTDETDERYEILGERWISTRDAELFYEYWLPYADSPGYPFTFHAEKGKVVIKEIPLT